MEKPVKHESTTQPGLFFWAEAVSIPGAGEQPAAADGAWNM